MIGAIPLHPPIASWPGASLSTVTISLSPSETQIQFKEMTINMHEMSAHNFRTGSIWYLLRCFEYLMVKILIENMT